MAAGMILILETDKEVLSSRARSLAREGYQVTAVNSIEAALEAVSVQAYDLLVLRPDAPELLNMLLARFPADLGVIIITTAERISRVAEGSGAGIHAFLIEHVTAPKLRDAVARALNARQAVIESVRDKAMAILGQARSLLTPGIDLDRYLGIVAEMSAIGTGADYICVRIKDGATSESRIRARYGEPKPDWDELCALAASSTPVVISEDMEPPHDLTCRLVAAGACSLMSTPLVVKMEAIGAIHHIRLQNKKPFAGSDVNFAAVLGWWTGVAMENLRLFQRVEQQGRQVEDLLQEVSHAQENERKRVAIEIHDGVAQWMVGATYSIKACAALVSQSRLTELQAELAKIGQTLQRSVRELRRTMANLRPLALEEGGLSTAIDQAVKRLAEDGVVCRLEVGDDLPELTFPQENTVYWILQETLTNIRSHASASRVEINIAARDGTMTVSVRDNGKGFNPEQTIKSAVPLEHMGLLGMQERARLLGGNLDIESQDARGTAVHFSFPLSARGQVNAIA